MSNNKHVNEYRKRKRDAGLRYRTTPMMTDDEWAVVRQTIVRSLRKLRR